MSEFNFNTETTEIAVEMAMKVKSSTPRTYLGMSQIGSACQRQLMYYFRHCYTEEISAQGVRIFRVGHNAEADMIADLEKGGITISGTQSAFSEVYDHFRGHCDGIGKGFPEFPDQEVLIEFKTAKNTSFNSTKKHGVEKDKPTHYAQMMIYGHLYGLDKAFYMVVNKDNSKYYYEFVDIDHNFAKLLLIRAESIILREELPPKVSDNKSFFGCKFCRASDICHFGGEITKSCRNCEFVGIEEEGKWSCSKKDGKELKEYTPCGEYKLDEFLNGK